MPRYFFGENASRPIKAGGNEHRFIITAMVAGATQGVVAVPDDQVEAFVAVASRFGVEEITQQAYEAAVAKKKASPRSQVFLDSPAEPAATTSPAGAAANVFRGSPLAIKGNGAVVVEGRLVAQRDKDALPASVDDIVQLGTGSPPTAQSPSQKETTRRVNHRDKRGGV